MALAWVGIAVYFVVVTFAVGMVLTRVSSVLATKLGILDRPHERGQHREPVPMLGGLGIAGALIVVVWLHVAAGHIAMTRPEWRAMVPPEVEKNLGSQWTHLLLLFGGGIVMAGVGLWDDIKSLSVKRRLVIEFAVAAVFVALGVRPSLGFLPDPLPHVVGVVWLVGIANAFNLLDGADGLAGGVGAICSLNLGIVMLLSRHPAMAVLLFCLCGACAGFLRYNWHPATTFMGSMGSLFIGYLLGAVTLIATFATPEAGPLFPILVPVLVFAVPLYDTASVILIRLRRRAPIFEGDRNHVHHRLLRLGFSTRQTVVFLLVMSVAFGLGAILIPRLDTTGNALVLTQALVLLGLIALMDRAAARPQ
jgi:UDP-GlcNAc:undecaprenyl-phosphate GlcNAc-1-phosphate transferase